MGVKPVRDHDVPGGAGGEASIGVSWKWNGKTTGNILRCIVAEFAFHGSLYVKNETKMTTKIVSAQHCFVFYLILIFQ